MTSRSNSDRNVKLRSKKRLQTIDRQANVYRTLDGVKHVLPTNEHEAEILADMAGEYGDGRPSQQNGYFEPMTPEKEARADAWIKARCEYIRKNPPNLFPRPVETADWIAHAGLCYESEANTLPDGSHRVSYADVLEHFRPEGKK